MSSSYIEWLKKQGVPLFEGGGIYWTLYQGALVPASASPCFIELSKNLAKVLLKESGAWLIRYASDPCEQKTEWWYIVCDTYDSKTYSAKTRRNINRGKRDCYVCRIDAEWLARHGYECYFSAFSRYKNASPSKKDIFCSSILKTIEGPFDYWGVFVEDRLAGYCQCIVDEKNIITNITKYDPVYLRHRTAYALISSLITHYVVDRGMILSNGNRSIAHDTNYQDVLISLGFRRQFCRLNVIYQPLLRCAIQTLFPLRRLITQLPDHGLAHKLQALLYQEKLRRACNAR